MKAIRIHEFGGPEVLAFETAPDPEPGPDEVLIRVHASSINPIDAGIQSGSLQKMFPLQLPVTPGFDVAGDIVKTGNKVKDFKTGDKVYGQAGVMGHGSGAFAELATTPASRVAIMPRNLTYIEAAVLPLTGLSAVQAIKELMKLQSGQKILIHGGAGGIGTIAIQLARHIGAYVAATATDDGVAYARELGADKVIDYQKEKFYELPEKYDAVFDTVGGDTYQQSFQVLKKGGIIVSMREQPDKKNMQQYGVRAIYEFTATTTERLNELTRLAEEGVIKVHVDETYALKHVKDAFESKTHRHVHGKIAIEV